MGKFLSVIICYLLICSGYQFFREYTRVSDESMWPSYIFLTSVLLLLYDLRLYPKTLRKLDKYSQITIEFLVALFLMEHILYDFWFPLETGTEMALIKLADKIDESKIENVQQFETVSESIKSSTCKIIAIYILSIFFLLSVLHAIRAVDFRALQDGPSCFFGDISYRLKRFLRKKLKILGIKKQRKVKIQESKEIYKSDCNGKRKVTENTSLDNFVIEDYDGVDNIDDASLQFNDFDIPNDNDLLCD
ncbi:uncharacterized protein LOC130903394 [Diorhabda carinulata]|uniref:uncharacterized protein LOC130903394 n=1 Tax=Diorhabda carinulata TaxID=1163345 RepID=UPI0025A2AA83|nr:uncharacterized protein LOC130903394 [Diorhabda carinulata]